MKDEGEAVHTVVKVAASNFFDDQAGTSDHSTAQSHNRWDFEEERRNPTTKMRALRCHESTGTAWKKVPLTKY